MEKITQYICPDCGKVWRFQGGGYPSLLATLHFVNWHCGDGDEEITDDLDGDEEELPITAKVGKSRKAVA